MVYVMVASAAEEGKPRTECPGAASGTPPRCGRQMNYTGSRAGRAGWMHARRKGMKLDRRSAFTVLLSGLVLGRFSADIAPRRVTAVEAQASEAQRLAAGA